MENLETKTDYRYGPKGTYKQSFIKEIVLQLEAGISPREIILQYGVSRSTIWDWENKYGDSLKLPVRRMSFTPVQKRSIARSVIE
jgi:DNA invertase Pin-like site-specific DNA recombinase